MKKTFEEWWFKFWGFGYLVNHNKKEIHRLKYKHVNCLTAVMTNKEYVNEAKASELLAEGYNGCRWCWAEKDKG